MGTILRGVRNVLRSPIRLVLVVAILGTSLMFVAAMFALNASAQQRLDTARASIGDGIDVRVAGSFGPFGGTGTLTADQVKTITSTSGVVSVSEAISQQYTGTDIKGNVAAQSNNGNGGTGTGGGGFPGGFNRFNDNGTIAPSIYGLMPGQSIYTLSTGSVAKLSSGRDLKTSGTTADVALMSASLASANGLKVGSTFTMESTKFTLVGLFTTGSTFSDDSIIIPLQTAQTVFKISGVSSVTAYAADDSTVDSVVSALKSALGSGVDVTSQASLNASTLTALKDAQGNMLTTLIVSIITSALVILFAVMLIVRERVREIGLLKAIGASHWQVVSQFAAEVLSLSGIAAVVALVLLALLGSTLASKFNISNTPASGFVGGRFAAFGGGAAAASQTPFSAGLSFGSLLVVLALGVALAVVASIIPAWYVARIKPAEVLRAD